MDRTNLVVSGLFAVACVAAVYRSRSEDRGLDWKVGTAVFLVGAAIGLFLDDVLRPQSPVLPRVEPIGATIVLVGVFVSWFWRPGTASSDRSH